MKKYCINTITIIVLSVMISSCGITSKDGKGQSGSNQIQKNALSDLSGNYQLELDSDLSEISLH